MSIKPHVVKIIQIIRKYIYTKNMPIFAEKLVSKNSFTHKAKIKYFFSTFGSKIDKKLLKKAEIFFLMQMVFKV